MRTPEKTSTTTQTPRLQQNRIVTMTTTQGPRSRMYGPGLTKRRIGARNQRDDLHTHALSYYAIAGAQCRAK